MAHSNASEVSASIPPVTLGRSDIVSSRLGLGCAGWPHQAPYEQVVDVFRTAFRIGVRHIDTAAKYGTEDVVGRAIQDAGAPPGLVLATKAGIDRDAKRFTADHVLRSVENSLRLLRVDRLDILHLHDCRTEHLDQVFGTGGALSALLKLKSEGVIRSIGVATSSLATLNAAIDSGDVDHIQCFHTYTLLNQDARDGLFPRARAANLSILNNGPYAGYILITGSGPGALYHYHAAPPEVIAAVQRIESVCERKGVALGTAALAFSLSCPQVDVTVIGASAPHKLLERAAAFNAPLSAADFDEMLAAAGVTFPVFAK